MFDYSKPSSVQAVIKGLSPARMAPYLKAASGDEGKALKLYEENTSRSATLYAQLQTFEVLMRNAFDRELSAPFAAMKPPPSWFDFQNGSTSLITGDSHESVSRKGRDHKKGLHRQSRPGYRDPHFWLLGRTDGGKMVFLAMGPVQTLQSLSRRSEASISRRCP